MNSKNSPPAELIPWLECRDFLTLKLKTASGDAQLQFLNQQELPTSWWDKYHLKITDTTVIVRNILMRSQDKPCWFARTIIPSSTYKQHCSTFERLKKESLGHIIFGSNLIQRQWLVHYAINARCIEFYWLQKGYIAGEKQLWLRLSEFAFKDGHVFYLLEVLLPGLLEVTS